MEKNTKHIVGCSGCPFLRVKFGNTITERNPRLNFECGLYFRVKKTMMGQAVSSDCQLEMVQINLSGVSSSIVYTPINRIGN